MSRARRRLPALARGQARPLIVLLGAAYAAGQFHALPTTPILEPDSWSYLAFYPTRTAGYPLFLSLFGPETALPAQVLLHAGALTVLGLTVHRAGLGLPLALGLLAAMMSRREVNHYHGVIMTESVFTSLLILFFAAAIGFLRAPARHALAGASALAGLAATVRPTGYALLPVLLLMPLMTRGGCRHATRTPLFQPLLAAVVPMLLLAGAEAAYRRHHHEGRTTSLAGRHLYAKAGMIEAPPRAASETMPARRWLFETLERDFAPIRTLLDQAPDGIRMVMVPDYETCLEYACTDPLRENLLREAGLSGAGINALMFETGLARLADAPREYLRLSWTHFLGMWSEFVRYQPRLFRSYAAFIADHRPLPFEAGVPDLIPGTRWNSDPGAESRPLRAGRVLLAAWLFVIPVPGLLFAARGRFPSFDAAVASLAGLTVQGMLAFTALLGVGIPRYIVMLWPVMMVSVAFSLAWAWRDGLQPRLSGHRSVARGMTVTPGSGGP